MSWYLVHTKPRQEKLALVNLERQGYECYLPVISLEKIIQGRIALVEEALFPRYIFIRLGEGGGRKKLDSHSINQRGQPPGYLWR